MSKLQLKIQNVLSSNIFFFIITISVILSLNLFPLISHIRHAPEGRIFALIHNNSQDFFFYQSLMNEGANGQWLTTDPYTTEPHQPSIIFSYFLWLGKLGSVLGISHALLYHITRILLGILLLYAVYRILYTALSIPYPRLAFFFFLFASPFMNGSQPFMYWWTGMDAIRRAAYLPHHMAGSLLLVLIITLLIQFVRQNSHAKTQNHTYLLRAIILSLLLAFIHTPSLFILLLILPPAMIIYSILDMKHKFRLPYSLKWVTRGEGLPARDKRIPGAIRVAGAPSDRFIPYGEADTGTQNKITRNSYTKGVGLLVYWLIGVCALLFMYSQTGKGFPWSQYINWERNLQFPLMKELIGAFGILFPFAILGAVKAFLSKRFDYILIACWFIVPVLLIPFAQQLNISNIRLIQGAPYVPMAILAVLGMKLIASFALPYSLKWVTRGEGLPTHARANTWSHTCGGSTEGQDPNYNRAKLAKIVVPALVLILFIVFTLPTLFWSLKDQIREFSPIYTNIYPEKKLFPAFAFINQNFKPQTKTISTFYTGNYLPAFTSTISFAGHFGYTYNVEKKQSEIEKFFKSEMTPQEAKELLLRSGIDLIFQGPEEKPLYNNYLYPEILRVIYDKEGITMYRSISNSQFSILNE